MNDNIHSLAAPYTLDAVTDAERDEFERHLPACEDCLAEVASLSAAADELALAHETTPPPSLRTDVMAEVSRTAQLPPQVDQPTDLSAARTQRAPGGRRASAGSASADSASADSARAGSARAGKASARPGGARRRWVVSAAAAASAVVLTLATVAVFDARAEREAQLALEKDVMMVASAPDAHSLDLALGTGHVVTSERMDSLAVMGTAAPMPDDDMEYQLWLVLDDGSKVAGPTFMPHDGEYMAVTDGAMSDVAAVAVTMEPPGGSSEPTTDPICVTEMPSKA